MESDEGKLGFVKWRKRGTMYIIVVPTHGPSMMWVVLHCGTGDLMHINEKCMEMIVFKGLKEYRGWLV